MSMLISVGYEVAFLFQKSTPVLALGLIHPDVASRIRKLENSRVEPRVPITEYRDGYGNRCSRMVVPAGPDGSRPGCR